MDCAHNSTRISAHQESKNSAKYHLIFAAVDLAKLKNQKHATGVLQKLQKDTLGSKGSTSVGCFSGKKIPPPDLSKIQPEAGRIYRHLAPGLGDLHKPHSFMELCPNPPPVATSQKIGTFFSRSFLPGWIIQFWIIENAIIKNGEIFPPLVYCPAWGNYH
ncbi:hypothetical protein [Desulfobacter sp.]|uniref:hypothetical protein n=1 Tax=Desulfobacter sp. TaxID=2294 RepID=UPI000E82932F|nr:hypothetical protein [Desulfobacter sp.]HBT86970.1 hypothetical protein [Desulfobacter sp.]